MSTVARPLAALVCAAFVSVSIAASAARATTLYASSFEGQSLWRVDTVALTATQIWSTTPVGQQPDSLCFDAAGNILYSAHFPGGGVRRVNVSASSDTAVATWTGHSTDLALEPSLTSVVCSDYIDPNLRRVNLSGGATVLATGHYFSGVTYFGNRLFANAGNTNQHGGDRVLELNPVTGAILNQSASNPAGVNTIGDLDGLTYDGFTGHLWATDEDASALIEINPNTLTTVSHPLPTNSSGGAMLPDGLCGDSAGKLWYASRGDFNIYEYNITSGTSTPVVNINGLDDLAPVSGLGSPSPEPAALSLIGLAIPLLCRARQRRRA
jgi:streptogramin lyase